MSKYKIMITDTLNPNIELERELFAAIGAEVFLASATDADTLIREGADCDGALVEFADMNALVMAGLKRCRIVVRTAIGYDNIDVAAATDNGIMVANVPDYCIEEVSDHALALTLACLRKVAFLDRQVRAGKWDVEAARPIRRVAGQTLCLFGFGHIARRLAQKAAPLGLKIAAYDPFLPIEAFAKAGVERLESLDELLVRADILSIHAPLNDGTRGIIGEEALGKMKPEAYLINTARGALVDLDAICRALRDGRIAGAGLDVMPVEPPPANHPIFALDNLVVTPHCSYYSDGSEEDLRRKSVRQAVLALTEGEPEHYINRPKREG